MTAPERRISTLLHTSTARLTLVYVGIFSVSVLLLVGLITWSATGFVARQIDLSAADELAELRQAAGSGGTPALARLIDQLEAARETNSYRLQDAAGRRLAGDLEGLSPIAGPRAFNLPSSAARGRGVRGRGVVLPDGAFLFVGASDVELRKLRAALAGAIVPGLLLMVILACCGGWLTSRSVLARVDAIGRASRDIMDGDLTRRVPLRGTGDEFDSLAIALNTMLDRIQELMRDLQHGASNIAHDLRTPLTRLRQRLERSLHTEQDPCGTAATLQRSIADIDAMLETFSALLRIAQIEAGTRRAGFTPVDLSALLGDLAETYEPVIEGAGKEWVRRLTPDLWVNGDRELLTQLMVNLIENAIRHASGGTRIILALHADGTSCVTEIDDDGPGIPAELRHRATQRFVRGEVSRTTPGSGLGLAMAAAIATLHGTSIELLSNNPGLRCVVRLAALQKSPAPNVVKKTIF